MTEGAKEEIQENKFSKKLEKSTDSFIDFIFSKDPRKWLILIVFFGAILRFFVARNVAAIGDEMVHGPHSIGFLHSGLISTILHCPLWFYLNDIIFQILGVTLFSLRFLSFFFGTLTIILIYLISIKIFSKRTALISSFLLAISFFTIRYTLAEMDLPALFFLVLALYLFMESLEKNKFPIMATICIGLAALIKTLALFFVPAFLIAFFIFRPGKEYFSKNLKQLILFGLIIVLIFSPIFIHNYLWYRDKGMVDTYFAQYFFHEQRIHYSAQLGFDHGLTMSPVTIIKGFWDRANLVFVLDPLILILGILGMLLAFSIKSKRKYFWLLVLFEFSGFFFLVMSNNGLQTHYTTLIPVLCIFGGFSINYFTNFLHKLTKFERKKILYVFLILILIFQFYFLMPYLTSSSGLGKMRNYAIDEMDKNSIVISDARIYRGRTVFLFHDFHYLESSLLPQILEANNQIPGEDIAMKVYFVEAGTDDSGWGAITEGPLNDSSERFVQTFASQSQPKIIYGGGGYSEKKGEEHFKIYQSTMHFKPQVINLIDSTHDWFYYPVNYIPEEKIFDNYDVYGIFNNLVYKIAWIILFLSVIFSIILSFLPIIKLIKTK